MAIYSEGDTIAAESTPKGRGGISVIRVSGAEAFKITGVLLDRPLPRAGRHSYGKLVEPHSNRVIDEAIVSVFDRGQSYTGEEVVELAVHGSPIVVADLLECLYRLGARPAEPGEFTLRAYLNGRLDLTQAEAVSDLIAATSRQSAEQAIRQLSGGLSQAVTEIEDLIEQLLVWCEVELDFVEEDVELVDRQTRLKTIETAIDKLEQLTTGYEAARRLREGVSVVITGAPNVGKSSLLNALLGEKRAIVHYEPGTTRDVVHGECLINGVVFELFDTAGLRRAQNVVEDEGIKRAWQKVKNADIVLAVSSVDIPDNPLMDLNLSCPIIEVLNKIDLNLNYPSSGRLAVSALTGLGIDILKERLYAVAMGEMKSDKITINRERHFYAAQRALKALKEGYQAACSDYTGEILAEYWREALFAMGEITGKCRVESLLEDIFSQFCIGK